MENTTLLHTSDGWPEQNNVAQILTTSNGRMVAYGHMTHDEARRLAACWNACQGASTEWLEDSKNIVLLAEPISGRFKALESQNRVLMDILLRAADAIEALDGTTTENEKLVDDYRAAIKATGGAA